MITLRRIASCLYHRVWCQLRYHIKLNYYWISVPRRVRAVRNKEKIKVLFIVSEAASWKSEMLYKAMLVHPRFLPVLGISTSSAPWGAKETLVNYLEGKEYQYRDLDDSSYSIKEIAPDIIFYYKPYSECYSQGHFYPNNLKYLFCGLDYCFEATKHAVHIDKKLFDYCWQFYVENDEIAKRRYEVIGYRARNSIITGVPMQDILLQSSSSFLDPWKDKTGKKRIIYAPHHSIKGTNGDGIEFATFLDFGEIILEFAKKYKDCITMAYKPHPNLYMKLIEIWGQEKTDAYYKEWETMSNTQIEKGEYVGLFKYSDAIIHDCASFIVEYLYMDNPSMYLVADTNNLEDMFNFVQEGYKCYEHGHNKQEIEEFIQDVIAGKDNRQRSRKEYIQKHLLPPGGKTASENILNAILGEK